MIYMYMYPLDRAVMYMQLGSPTEFSTSIQVSSVHCNNHKLLNC